MRAPGARLYGSHSPNATRLALPGATFTRYSIGRFVPQAALRNAGSTELSGFAHPMDPLMPSIRQTFPSMISGRREAKRFGKECKCPLCHDDAHGVKACCNDRQSWIGQGLAADREAGFLNADAHLREGNRIRPASKIVPKRSTVCNNALLPVVGKADHGKVFSRERNESRPGASGRTEEIQGTRGRERRLSARQSCGAPGWEA